ncbi:monovalent cation/H+ antiporter complex subunit F [Luteimonas abyssi]|uniref:monovalent cation/H+ antiporter complex subunit F n=1 Tax=Luteimonas abyssi TaxID=1247514 RepID=UPI000737B7A0|nr:monovalent cation/H+ antiporter complex subunit F [Luteimonas abyssi]
MTGVLEGAAALLLLTVAGSLFRIHRGPGRADRMMSAQLVGTGGIGVLLLLAGVSGEAAVLDVALVLALLAALASVAFVKATSPDGAGDPEEPS